jgi:CRISPR/Cas system CMR subunit Cmr6 (Cas7 group RAMP superfamily)
MSTDNSGSADNQTSSASADQTPQDKVSYETYRRVLSEAKKLKEQNKLYEEEKNKNQEQKLKDQNEWKTLAETYKQQLEEKSTILKEQEASIVNGMKYQEFEKQLGGKLKNRDYATFIEFDKIVMNPETKTIDTESVKGVVSNFVKQHSHLVEFQTGRLPNEAARTTTSFGGSKKIEDMSAKELESYIKDQAKAGLIK